ncbi:MAG: site-specific DNA-methyltransferase [Microbacterium ginsengisoli]|nr:site-specific DNA-methyltransferase [Microbacterium ginsengisoli]
MKQTYEIRARRVSITNNDTRRTGGNQLRSLRRDVERLETSLQLQPLQPLIENLDRHNDRGESLHREVDGLAPTLRSSVRDRDLPIQPFPQLHPDSLRHTDDDPASYKQSPVSVGTADAPAAAPPAARVHDRQPSPPTTAGTAAAETTPTVSAAAPTLYYQDRLVTLYHGDCLTHPHLWTHGDVLITDPPYGLQALAGAYGFASSKRGSVTIANDLDTTVRDAVLELWGDKPAAVFGTPRLPEPPGGWVDRLVWDKQQLGLNGGAWRYAHETIFVRGSGWRRISDASSSILRHSSAANRAHIAKHIHSKPEKVLAELIAAAPDGVIVDTFAGGGSTVAAARALGRRIIAFELEEQYCEAIAERISSRLDLGDS